MVVLLFAVRCLVFAFDVLCFGSFKAHLAIQMVLINLIVFSKKKKKT